jgi:hypothetical protein
MYKPENAYGLPLHEEYIKSLEEDGGSFVYLDHMVDDDGNDIYMALVVPGDDHARMLSELNVIRYAAWSLDDHNPDTQPFEELTRLPGSVVVSDPRFCFADTAWEALANAVDANELSLN